MSYKLLLVEDDEKICEVIYDYFTGKDAGRYEVFVANDGYRGEELLYEQDFDIILLDVMLPRLDGFSLCREIRKSNNVPIIFITARGREEDVLYGYELGADDYTVKPFRVSELYAKVNAHLNRSKGMVLEKKLRVGGICLDAFNYTVNVEDEEISLQPKEYTLLKYLMERKGETIDRETLLAKIWGYEFEGTERVVDNHIKNIRKKLGEQGRHIKTVVKHGYKIE